MRCQIPFGIPFDSSLPGMHPNFMVVAQLSISQQLRLRSNSLGRFCAPPLPKPKIPVTGRCLGLGAVGLLVKLQPFV